MNIDIKTAPEYELMGNMQELEDKIVLACEEVMKLPYWMRETIFFEAFKTVISNHHELGDDNVIIKDI